MNLVQMVGKNLLNLFHTKRIKPLEIFCSYIRTGQQEQKHEENILVSGLVTVI